MSTKTNQTKSELNPLTEKELNQLNQFIGKCVLQNVSFPSNMYGSSNNITIQDLAGNRSVDSLKKFGIYIKKQLNDSDPDFSDAEPLKFGDIHATDLVDNLKLLIRYKEYKQKESKLKEELRELKRLEDDLKTPEERRKEVAARKAQLEIYLK